MMQADLFDDETAGPAYEQIADGAVLLRGFCRSEAESLIRAVGGIAKAAPFRHLVTPGGFTMSVSMTNCGRIGWVSDRRGYRYSPHDPATGLSWPGIPAEFADLARRAAAAAGFASYRPESCLINRYEPGARLSLHQDRDEHDYSQPIVSVSLGLPATFLFGGLKRTDRPRRLRLVHGDVAVWGGPSRLAFHGIAPLADGVHPMLGAARINLTFRTAL